MARFFWHAERATTPPWTRNFTFSPPSVAHGHIYLTKVAAFLIPNLIKQTNASPATPPPPLVPICFICENKRPVQHFLHSCANTGGTNRKIYYLLVGWMGGWLVTGLVFCLRRFRHNSGVYEQMVKVRGCIKMEMG